MKKGIVKEWNEGKHFGVVRADDDGKTYLVLRSDITHDDAGRQFLIIGEPVAFAISEVREDRAINVQPAFREPVAIEHEIVTLRTWNAVYGWAKREFGGDLFVDINHIVTLGLDTLGPGSRIWCIAAPPDRRGDRYWIASRAEIVMDGTPSEFPEIVQQ